jgi:WhiB family redox-sensing transcriptional regulator
MLLDSPETAQAVMPTADQLLAELLPCRSGDPELWFAEHTAEVERAKALCQDCPAVEPCLAGALERAEPWGVWGGQVFVGGVVAPTKRGRGRPPKNRAA